MRRMLTVRKRHTAFGRGNLLIDLAGAAGARSHCGDLGLERALEADEDCSDVLQLITAARGAMNGLMAELLEGHIRFHVINPKQLNSEQALATDELIEIVRSYLK